MKLVRGIFTGLFIAGLVAVFSPAAFAVVQKTPPVADKGMHKAKGWTESEKKEHELAQIKLFNDSAAALQKINPGLAASLTKYANEEAQELAEGKEGKGEKQELEGKTEKDMASRAADNIKLLRDSAAALQKTNPSLAEELTKTANKHAKRMEMKKAEKGESKAMEAKEKKEMPFKK